MQVRWQVCLQSFKTHANLCAGYPESLLVYHAGVGRTVFLGCLKVTTLILFVASCSLLAPPLYRDAQAPRGIAVVGMFSIPDSPTSFLSNF